MLASYTRTAEPATEPVTAAEAISFCKAYDTDETEFGTFVSAARDYVEKHTGRALITQTWKLTQERWPHYCDAYGARTIRLDRTPLVSVTSVKYYPADGSAQVTLSSTKYIVVTASEPGVIFLKDGETWPDLACRPDAVEIVFVAGATDAASVPKGLRHAVLLLTSHLDLERAPVNVGNIVNEVPFGLRAFIESQRVGGWVA